MSFRNRAHREDELLRPAASGARGFTLLETTIAMVVMMVVGLGATSLFFYAVRSNSGGEQRSQALAIAQQRLEQLRTLPYNDPQLNVGQTTSTVVLQDVESAGDSANAVAAQNDGGGVQAYGSGAASGGGMSAFGSKPGKGGGGSPTPTPDDDDDDDDDDEEGGGGGGGTTGGDDEYKVVLDVQGLPAGSATPTRKRITIVVTPENGYGANSWINQNPVVIVIHRSSPATGPYRQ
jgi:type II secretory pathway pseudopilin PulG